MGPNLEGDEAAVGSGDTPRIGVQVQHDYPHTSGHSVSVLGRRSMVWGVLPYFSHQGREKTVCQYLLEYRIYFYWLNRNCSSVMILSSFVGFQS